MQTLPVNAKTSDDELYYADQRLQQYLKPIPIKRETKRTTTESFCTYYCYPQEQSQFDIFPSNIDAEYDQNFQYQNAMPIQNPPHVTCAYSPKTGIVSNYHDGYAINEMESLLLGLNSEPHVGMLPVYNDNVYSMPDYNDCSATTGVYDGWNHQTAMTCESKHPSYHQLTPPKTDFFGFTTDVYNHEQYITNHEQCTKNKRGMCDVPYESSNERVQNRKRKRVSQEVRVRLNGRYRTPYDEIVKNALETEFNDNKYITAARKAELAPLLQLTNRQIKIWFQNRRAKERRMHKRTEDT